MSPNYPRRISVILTALALPPVIVGFRYAAEDNISKILAVLADTVVPPISFMAKNVVLSFDDCNVIVAPPNVPLI